MDLGFIHLTYSSGLRCGSSDIHSSPVCISSRTRKYISLLIQETMPCKAWLHKYLVLFHIPCHKLIMGGSEGWSLEMYMGAPCPVACLALVDPEHDDG